MKVIARLDSSDNDATEIRAILEHILGQYNVTVISVKRTPKQLNSIKRYKKAYFAANGIKAIVKKVDDRLYTVTDKQTTLEVSNLVRFSAGEIPQMIKNLKNRKKYQTVRHG